MKHQANKTSHSALNSMYCELKCDLFFWYCRTGEDMLQRLRFCLLLTYLLT